MTVAEPGHEALATSVAAAYPWARRVALLLCRDAQAAEDLVQDAFVLAVRRNPEARTPEAFAAWLRIVLYRLAIRRTRSLTREARAMARSWLPGRDRDPAETRHDDAVLEAVRALGTKQRACVVLRYYEDLDEEEIGRILGIRPGTVKAHLAQSRERLSRSLS